MIKKSFLVFLLGLTVFATSGFSCTGEEPLDPELFKPITLNYWRVFDDSDSMGEIIAAYQSMHPNVSINYRKFRYDEYESELLNGFADDRGPDIFSLHSTWVDKYRSKLTPLPTQWTVGTVITTGNETNKKSTPKQYSVAGMTPSRIRTSFVDTVGADVIRTEKQEERIYGLPLALDTLALYYNKDLLDNAGIIEPPKTWDEFQEAVASMTKRNSDDDSLLDQSAAALGTAGNVQRSFDILSTIMAQSRAQMSDESGPTFDQIPAGVTTGYPAADALRFYTDFAYPGKEGIYTWNEDMPDSVEAFQQGRTAMMFGYSYHTPLLRTFAPRLRFGVVPVPQLDRGRPANTANYWVETVSKKASSAVYAWDFLQFASSEERVPSYLSKTRKPTALRSLIASQQSDEALFPFVSQVLYAKNWYHGKSPADAEAAFIEMITSALNSKGGSLAQQRGRLAPIIQRASQKIRYGW